MKDDMETMNIGKSHYGFSATKLSNLGASEYTLAVIAVDVSGSVSYFKDEIEKCLREIIIACQKSPRADNLLVRIIKFGGYGVDEIHGFKLLSECGPDSYIGTLNCNGSTPLFDACISGLGSIETYGNTLFSNDFDVNAIFIAITDGEDNNSTSGMSAVRNAIDGMAKREDIESLVSILVGVNITDTTAAKALKDFSTTSNFTQYVEIDNAKSSTIAKLAQFVSKSISSQSQSLGKGAASQPLSF